MASSGKQRLAQLTLTTLAVSIPVVAAAAPALAAERPRLTFSTDADGNLLASVNRGEKAIKSVDCYLPNRLVACVDLDQLSTKKSTTYVLGFACRPGYESACAAMVDVDGTVVVTVTLTDGATVTGSYALPGNESAVAALALAPTFGSGVSM
jgi:hypothetical protein